MNQLRVWWVPQVPMKAFYVPVNSILEGKKVLDTLAAYDAFQFQNKVKSDYSNMGGLQEYDVENKEWIDWYLDDSGEDIKDYAESDDCIWKDEFSKFKDELFKQIDWDLIKTMSK